MKIGKKFIISLILLLFFLLIIGVIYYYNVQETYMLTPLPLFVPTTLPPDVFIPQGESQTTVVGFSYNAVVREPDTVSFYLSSTTMGEVPPFVHATFDPEVTKIRPEERFYSNLTLKIDSNAPIGKYYLSAAVKSSRFGGHARYDGVWVCGDCGACFYLNVIGPKEREEIPPASRIK